MWVKTGNDGTILKSDLEAALNSRERRNPPDRQTFRQCMWSCSLCKKVNVLTHK